MQENKIPKWLWMLVAIINLIIIVSTLKVSHDKSTPIIELFGNILLPLICTIVPLLISQSDAPWKNKFKKSYLFLLIIPYIYFIYDYFTCTGKLCDIWPVLFILILSAFIGVFTLFYTIAEYSLKREVRPTLMILLKEILAFVVIILLFYLI